MLIFNQSDEDLMEWVCIDQTGALEELIRRYENKFLATAYHATRNHASAEDIVQDTFTKIWEDCLSFNKKIAKFSTWAYAILQARINMHLRNRRKDREMISLSAVDEDKDDLLASAQTNWFDDCSAARLQKLKEMIFKYLNVEEQLLYHFKEELRLSYEEIRQLEPFKGKSIASLKMRRMRYIDKLIDALEMEKYNFKCLPREVKNGKNEKM